MDVINSLYLTNNKAGSYLYVQGDAGYDKYTYVNQRQAFSRPVPSRLLSGAIRYLGTIELPSGIHHLVLDKPPSGATFSGKDLGPMFF